jgi:uncharacterized OB-fold protein
LNAVASDRRIKTNPHIFVLEGEAPGAPGLRGTFCRACNRVTLGRAPICSHCFSREVEMRAAGKHAVLVEFSIAHHPAGGFAAPYAIGMIRTAEGLTLFSPLVGDTDSLRPGTTLKFVTIERDAGQIGFAYAVELEPEKGQ